MVSRATHFRNKAKHAQRPFGYVHIPAVKEDDWIELGMNSAREIGRTMNAILLEQYAERVGCSPQEADRQLRRMASMGFLKMSVEREGDTFLRYKWELTDPNLPD